MATRLKTLKLSASAIKTYEQCNRKYFYNYIERPKIEKKDWSHLKIGLFAHEVLDQFHKTLLKNSSASWPESMSAICKKEVSNFNLDKVQRGLASEMLKDYLDKLARDGLPNVVASEQSFAITIEDNILLKGFIDRIDDDQEFDGDKNYKYHIVDYKSGKSKYLDEFQLLIYGLYLLDKFPDLERFKGSYIMLAEGSKHYMPSIFTRTDLDNVKEKIRKVANDIRTDKTWEPKPQFLCKYCDYNKLCPASSFRVATNGRKEW